MTLCASLLYWVAQQPYFRIAHVDIHTTDGAFHRAKQQDIFQALLLTLSGSFFSIDLQKAEQIAKQQDWVQDVQIKRVLPNKVWVQITEYSPKARWIRNGSPAGLVNEEGMIFQAAIEDQLPELDGEAKHLKEMLIHYQRFQSRLTSLHLNIKRLQYTPRGAWTIMLDNGVEVRLGSQDVHSRLANFVNLWASDLQPQAHNVDYVDMRYDHGAAVGWLGEKPLPEIIEEYIVAQ